MTNSRSYRSPADFRRALTDRLRAKAESGRWTLPELQRQMAYDRLLERLYLVDNNWIVKGATALLARDIAVRATIDVDVYRQASSREIAEAELRGAAARDIGDWFTFEIGARHALSDAADGVRLPVTALIGTTVWTSFHVDLVGQGLHMTGEPEGVPALARVVMPDVEQHGHRRRLHTTTDAAVAGNLTQFPSWPNRRNRRAEPRSRPAVEGRVPPVQRRPRGIVPRDPGGTTGGAPPGEDPTLRANQGFR